MQTGRVPRSSASRNRTRQVDGCTTYLPRPAGRGGPAYPGTVGITARWHQRPLGSCMAQACRRVYFTSLLLSTQRHGPACICNTSVTFIYCCCACMCWCVCQNAGLLGGTKETAGPLGNSSLASWGEWELHRLVAHFLAARFPILLALNKVSQGCCFMHAVPVSYHEMAASTANFFHACTATAPQMSLDGMQISPTNRVLSVLLYTVYHAALGGPAQCTAQHPLSAGSISPPCCRCCQCCC